MKPSEYQPDPLGRFKKRPGRPPKHFKSVRVPASVPHLMRIFLNGVRLVSPQFSQSRLVQFAIMRLAMDLVANPDNLQQRANAWNSLCDEKGVGWEHHIKQAIDLVFAQEQENAMLSDHGRPNSNDDTERRSTGEDPEAG
jgi:hypothetical protein